jgi:hypothetical protein
MKRYALVVACVVAGVMTVSVLAADAEKGKGEGKGKGAEGKGRFEMVSFQKMDANADGKVTLEEYTAAMAEMLKERFNRADLNADGGLSEDELNKSREAFRGRGPRGGEAKGKGKGE